MINPSSLFLNLLLKLREDLVTAYADKDNDKLHQLFITFGVLRDACDSGPINAIFTDLVEATRDALGGFDPLREISTVSAIRAAFIAQGLDTQE